MRGLRYVSLAVWLFAGAQVYGQSPKVNMSEFRGRLIEGTDLSYDRYVIEITNLVDRSVREHADVFSDGSFAIRAVPDGDYLVRVLTLYGAEIAATMTSIGPSSSGLPCEIPLPQEKLQKPISGTVSIQQLSHPLSKQVRKLLDSGQKLIQEQRYSDAAVRLREATQDDPQCLQAHADLGLTLSKMGAWDGAIEEYQAATSLDPGNSALHSNLSAALASAKRFDEARDEALLALRYDSRNARAHFVMAGVLLQAPGHLQEAVPHLRAAQDSFPSARKALEKLCAMKAVNGCP